MVPPPPSFVPLISSIFDFLDLKPTSNVTLLCSQKSSVHHSIDSPPVFSHHKLLVWWQNELVTFPGRGPLETSLLRLVQVTGRNSQPLLLMAFSNVRKGSPLAQSTKVIQKPPASAFSRHPELLHIPNSITHPSPPHTVSQGSCNYPPATGLIVWPPAVPLSLCHENDCIQVLRLKMKNKKHWTSLCKKIIHFFVATSYHPDFEYHFSWLGISNTLFVEQG